MEKNRTSLRPSMVSGVPLNDKQLAQGFRISGGVEGVLTRLFHIICLDVTGGRGISPIQWNKLMIDYIRQESESNTMLDRSSIRGNMNKVLRRPSMTWNAFTLNGLKFLQFEAFTVSIYGELLNGKEFSAHTSVSFVPNSKFAHLFPVELECPPAVQVLDKKGRRSTTRTYAPGASGVLAKLFNLICLSITDGKGYSQVEWNNLLTKFIDEGPHRVPLTAEKRQSIRGNWNKEFRRPKMMWRVFCKALQFQQAANFTIHVIGYRKDGTISECETGVNFAPRV